MPPRRATRASSSNPIPEHLLEPAVDRERFVGARAQKFYYDFSHRQFNVEREFQYKELGLDEIIDFYEWRRLAKRPANNGIGQYVKEFYANAYENGKRNVNSFVRGVRIDYGYDEIARYYSMANKGNPETCAYARLCYNINQKEGGRKKYHLLLDTFPNFDPDKVKSGIIMKTAQLDLRLRALHRFICERILPSTHYNDLHWRRAALMHLAVNQARFNTGAIIFNEIHETIKGMGNMNYNFPILITGLMARSGLALSRVPRDLIPGSPITYETLTKQSHPKHGASSSRGPQDMDTENEGDEEEGNDEPDWEIHPDEATYYMSGLVDNMTEEFGRFQVRVEREFEEHNQWRGGVDTALATMQQRQIEMQHQQNTEVEAARAWRAQQTRESEQQHQLLQMMWARLAPPPQLPPPNQGGWDSYYHPRPPPQ